MAFPVSPTEGQTFTEYNTVWIYSAVTDQWNRSVINPLNETLYEFGGSATATGNAGEIQYTDGTNLAASPNLLWDNANNELEVGGDVVLDDGGTYTTTLQTITPTAARTISFPDATGTVALVGGSSGQLVYNNAGAQAGAPGSVVGATGDITLTLNGAASTPPLDITGTWFTGGTSTTTKPQVLIEPTGATSTAWSTSGTGLGVNAASGFVGRLLDLQVNGTSQLSVSSLGSPLVGLTSAFNSGTAKGYYFASGNFSFRATGAGIGVYSRANNYPSFYFGSTTPGGGHSISSDIEFGWSSTTIAGGTSDVILARDAADTLAQRRTTNAQTFRVYNTYTSSTSYERAKLEWSSNVLRIGTEKGSAGGTARDMELQTDGTTRITVKADGAILFSGVPTSNPAVAGQLWNDGGTLKISAG
jgi:hypothetical protein